MRSNCKLIVNKNLVLTRFMSLCELQLCKLESQLYRRHAIHAAASHQVISTSEEGLWFDSRAGQIGQCLPRLATAVMFLRICVAQALSRGDGPRHSLHASA